MAASPPGPFDEKDITDVDSAKKALRWALERIRSLEDRDVGMRHEVQNRIRQIQLLEQKLRDAEGEPPEQLYDLQKNLQDLQNTVRQKDAEIAALLEVGRIVGGGAPPEREAELNRKLGEKDAEIASLQIEIENLKAGRPSEERMAEWTNDRVRLIAEFRRRAERLEGEFHRRLLAMVEGRKYLEAEVVRRQQRILEREWRRLHVAFRQKEEEFVASYKRATEVLKTEEEQVRRQLQTLEDALSRLGQAPAKKPSAPPGSF